MLFKTGLPLKICNDSKIRRPFVLQYEYFYKHWTKWVRDILTRHAIN